MAYDDDNIFAKILRGEIPCNKVFENDHAFAFHDINPQATVHVLVIPKGPYVDMDDFTSNAPGELVLGFFDAVGKVARDLGLATINGGSGYRVIANGGPDARQEVPHFHVHILGGQDMGRMVDPDLQPSS